MSSQHHPFLKWSAIALMLVAGGWTLFHLIWNVAAQTSDDQWGTALLILFLLALILAFVQFFLERQALSVPASGERFPEPALAKFFLASEGDAVLVRRSGSVGLSPSETRNPDQDLRTRAFCATTVRTL